MMTFCSGWPAEDRKVRNLPCSAECIDGIVYVRDSRGRLLLCANPYDFWRLLESIS